MQNLIDLREVYEAALARSGNSPGRKMIYTPM